jgi:transcriptional regulator with GAF, ATPase, and Fis domain
MLNKVYLIGVDSNADYLKNAIKSGLLKSGHDVECKQAETVVYANGVVIIVCSRLDNDAIMAIAGRNQDSRIVIVGTNGCEIDLQKIRRMLAAGVSEYLHEKSCDIVSELSTRLARWRELDRLMENLESKRRIIGQSRVWKSLLRRVMEVAHFTDDSILLCGETGTGKELMAQLVHDSHDTWKKGKYNIIDCTTIVPGLSGSEFFGHERGAFSGAYSSRDGAFTLADGGTLFLDEIGELPMELQAQLLRVIQEGTYKKVGSNVWHSTRFRLVCATNKNLLNEIESGRFRHDLYYRIAQWTFTLPSLSERADDIIPLAKHFLGDNIGKNNFRFDPLVEDLLRKRCYPGNIRELRQLMARFRLLKNGSDLITAGCVPPDEWAKIPDFDGNIHGNGSWIGAALERALGLEQIIDLARQQAIEQVIREELAAADFDIGKWSIVLKNTSIRLNCSLRWIQKCSKELHIYENLSLNN